MTKALVFAAMVEILTGLALLLAPSLVGSALLGQELTGLAVVVGRVTGIALVAFGVACWPGPPLLGMVIYGAGVALYLALVGLSGGMTGPVLWPAVGLHVILTALLAREAFGKSGSGPR
jgi:hypothetical protein